MKVLQIWRLHFEPDEPFMNSWPLWSYFVVSELLTKNIINILLNRMVCKKCPAYMMRRNFSHIQARFKFSGKQKADDIS